MQRLKLNSSSSKTLKNSINESKNNLNDSAILGYGSRFVTNSFLIHSERDVSALNLNKSLNVSQIQSRPSSAPETTRNSFKNNLSPTEANKKLNE